MARISFSFFFAIVNFPRDESEGSKLFLFFFAIEPSARAKSFNLYREARDRRSINPASTLKNSPLTGR